MLERKRRTKPSFTGEDGEEYDVELGEDFGPQEEGVVRDTTLEEEVDNWDENAEDWDEDPTTAGSQADDSTKTASSEDAAPESKKRND